ncbi:cytochrome P450 [Dactylosporangium cerinum]|uniref:Cytochrome P450 n=1 Tax=Dactylosporangium cerinum TaxID=1434730 RepID=A0ABV9VPP0_9ACTN
MEPRCPVVIDPNGHDIHAEGSRIHANGPISRIELPGGVLAWSVTGHDAASAVLTDRRFSKDPRKHWDDFLAGKVGEDFPLIGWVLMENLTTAYGNDHSRLRKPCANAFTPRRVEAMRPRVEQHTAALLDELAATAPGEVVDIKSRFAHTLPSRVICELFGVPEQDRLEMLRGGEVNSDTTISPEESAANFARWHQQMLDFVEAKRRDPGTDLTSDLIATMDQPDGLSPDEIVGTLHIMLATGTEPVKNLIGNAVAALLTKPDQRKLVEDGSASWDDLIDETLRAEAPVAHLPFRFAVEDVTVGGVTIAKGEPVLINFAAVGRDPAAHEGPGEFDVTRPDKDNLSFGAGIYRCIGQSLARLEAQVALPALFERFPGITLAVDAEDLRPQGTFIMNGLDTVPVRLQ